MPPALTSILILILSMNSDPTFAQTDYEFTVVSGDQLKNNPFAQNSRWNKDNETTNH